MKCRYCGALSSISAEIYIPGVPLDFSKCETCQAYLDPRLPVFGLFADQSARDELLYSLGKRVQELEKELEISKRK